MNISKSYLTKLPLVNVIVIYILSKLKGRRQNVTISPERLPLNLRVSQIYTPCIAYSRITPLFIINQYRKPQNSTFSFNFNLKKTFLKAKMHFSFIIILAISFCLHFTTASLYPQYFQAYQFKSCIGPATNFLQTTYNVSGIYPEIEFISTTLRGL